MSATSVDTDPDNLTVTLIADFDAAIDQIWDLWSDPRKLEQWRVTAVDPPTWLEFTRHDQPAASPRG